MKSAKILLKDSKLYDLKYFKDKFRNYTAQMNRKC